MTDEHAARFDALMASIEFEEEDRRRQLPDEFWTARPILDHVRQAARASVAAPDAVLANVLARVAAQIHPSTTLRRVVGNVATFDVLLAVVGPPGSGKSSANSVARDLAPIRNVRVDDGFQLGTGEGLLDRFLGKPETVERNGARITVRPRVLDGVLAYVDEGQVINELSSRSGATLLPTLRTAWSGGALGQNNADAERNRRLDARTYRVAAVFSLQPEHAADVLADAPGGTPQRILWFSALDPNMPDHIPDWPGPIDWTQPARIDGGLQLGVADEIVAEINATKLRRTRGEEVVDSLDAHRGLLTSKVAGLFAVLDDRRHITVEDWQLASILLDTSDAVRTHVQAQLAAERRARERRANEREARKVEHVDRDRERRALVSAARSVARKLHSTHATVTRRTALRAASGDYRKLAGEEAILDLAIGKRWVEAVDDDHVRAGAERP